MVGLFVSREVWEELDSIVEVDQAHNESSTHYSVRARCSERENDYMGGSQISIASEIYNIVE